MAPTRLLSLSTIPEGAWVQRVAVLVSALSLSAISWLVSPPAFGIGGCVFTTCSAAEPVCGGARTWGLDNCGQTCSKPAPANVCNITTAATCNAPASGTYSCTGGACTSGSALSNVCNITTAATCSAPASGTYSCTGGPCTSGSALSNVCNITTAATCSAPASGTYSCTGGVCTTGRSLSCPPWQTYGFAVPGDPVYGFPQVEDDDVPVLDVASKDLVGLAAKGNIIIGDYTSPTFQNNVLPNLRPGSNSKTQPYVVDPTDADLGYDSADPSLCGGISPCFAGNYTVRDKDGLLDGTQTDGDARLFYESTLADSAFRPLVSMPWWTMVVDAVLYTNHALAGWIPSWSTQLNGALVGRDDGIMTTGGVQVSHDIRLLDGAFAQQVVLPLTISRPTITGFRECPPDSC